MCGEQQPARHRHTGLIYKQSKLAVTRINTGTETMNITIAINHQNGNVSRFEMSDPYAAYNHIQNFHNTKMIAAAVKCTEIYTIGLGEYAKKSCSYCPLFHDCLCENRVVLPEPTNQKI